MKKLLILILSILLLSSCGNTTFSTKYQERLIILQDSTQSLSETLSPAIVGVQSITNGVGNIGAGVCVAPKGIIITNSHVINNAETISLYLQDGTNISANIVYEDTVLDFAIVKSNKEIPYLRLSEENVNVGEDVLAVGTPLSLNLTHTFTKGIISATNRSLKVSLAKGEGIMQNLIQHDASLNPGNSGGPLINERGEIIGINTLKISGGEGIGFAIPVKSFKSLLNNYLSDEEYVVPYLGVYGMDCEIANFQGITDENNGFYVIDIASNSPMKHEGLESGGVITKINNRLIINTLDFKDENFNYYTKT